MKKLLLIACVGFLATFVRCNNDPVEIRCYDGALDTLYMDSICSGYCPGVCGCDNKTYCNPCQAAKLGVVVVDSLRPCSQ